MLSVAECYRFLCITESVSILEVKPMEEDMELNNWKANCQLFSHGKIKSLKTSRLKKTL